MQRHQLHARYKIPLKFAVSWWSATSKRIQLNSDVQESEADAWTKP